MKVHFNILFSILLLVLVGCKAQKQTVDYTNQESTITTTVHDTIIMRDTITIETVKQHQTESTEGGTITFVAGGGTYNTQTGEAVGVASVEITKREKELTKENEMLQKRLDFFATNYVHRDSLTTQTTLHEKTESKPKTNWYWFLIIGFSIGVGVVILLKKLPYTRPFMAWL